MLDLRCLDPVTFRKVLRPNSPKFAIGPETPAHDQLAYLGFQGLRWASGSQHIGEGPINVHNIHLTQTNTKVRRIFVGGIESMALRRSIGGWIGSYT